MPAQVDFLPDGHYQQDSITLEDQQRRMELFNAAVDSYIAGGCGPGMGERWEGRCDEWRRVA